MEVPKATAIIKPRLHSKHTFLPIFCNRGGAGCSPCQEEFPALNPDMLIKTKVLTSDVTRIFFGGGFNKFG